MATCLWLGAACSGGPPPAASVGPVAAEPGRELSPDQFWVLEHNGPAPEDTTVTFPAGRPRAIILRHGAPDIAVFAEIWFPAEASSTSATSDSITVSVVPRAGVYGADVSVSAPLRPGARIRFKYPTHFSAPAEALRAWGGAGRVERSLVVVRQFDTQRYLQLPVTRPASDNLEAPLAGPGRYLVVAPRPAAGR